MGVGFNLFDHLLVKISKIMLVNNSMFNFYIGNGFAIEFRVRGWVVGGGPSNFIVNQSPNPWI